jgi:hypothetical protein
VLIRECSGSRIDRSLTHAIDMCNRALGESCHGWQPYPAGTAAADTYKPCHASRNWVVSAIAQRTALANKAVR